MPPSKRRPYLNGLGLNGHRDSTDWADEKEPPHLHSIPPLGPSSIAEHPAFDNRVCGDCRLAECECRCPTCDVPSYRECEVCRTTHALQVEREHGESFAMTELVLTQLRMCGLL